MTRIVTLTILFAATAHAQSPTSCCGQQPGDGLLDPYLNADRGPVSYAPPPANYQRQPAAQIAQRPAVRLAQNPASASDRDPMARGFESLPIRKTNGAASGAAATQYQAQTPDPAETRHLALLAAINGLAGEIAQAQRPVRQVGYSCPGPDCPDYEAHQVQLAPRQYQQIIEQPLPVQVEMPAPAMHPVEVPMTPPHWRVTSQYHQSAPVIDSNRNFQHARPKIVYIDGQPVISIDPEPTDIWSRLCRFIHGD